MSSFFFTEPGVDFNLPFPSQVEFPALTSGTSSQCMEVAIVDDEDYEGEHTFVLSFLPDTMLPVNISTVATVITIIDNGG